MGLAEDHSHRGKRLSTWTITADWKEFAFLMDLDPEGKQVATIEAENAHKRDILFICCHFYALDTKTRCYMGQLL